MLDSDTKRRIDSCRDILVGKVPNPQAQVEQITIAMIYKFMDDMDAEAEEFGGARKFFAGEFAKYSWPKLMAPNMGGFDVLALYSEAIQKMNENPGIPPLFRDIFKNAYLPYRDPETLRIFLKEINWFTYDHSERLGDAFEYLLSVLGSQGDAGQFRTPRNIIDFMVEIINPKKNETILDTACGTSGFLISSYKHILKNNSTDYHPKNDLEAYDEKGISLELVTIDSPLHYKGDLLTPDDRKKLSTNIFGYDISPDMVRLSLVNMYLHGFTHPNIIEYDTLTSDERWNEYADIILANPPFMSPKGGIKPHKRFSVQAKRSEVLFVDYIAEHLTPSGRAAIIVPEGIIFQSGTAYKQLRKMLVDSYLVAVVSLPAGVFNPYSGVKTSILILDRRLSKKTENVLFAKIENDGFGLGAQRRAIDKNDLPAAAKNIKAYLDVLRNDSEFDLENIHNLHLVEKSKIAENGEWNLNGEKYRVNRTLHQSDYEIFPIGDICDLINGRAFKPEDWKTQDSGGLPIIRIQNLNNLESDFNYYTGEYSEKHLIKSGELLFSWSGSKGTSFGAHIWRGNDAILNQHIFKVLFDENRALKSYLYYILNRAVSTVEENLHGGVGLVHITKGDFERIKIPLPPIDVQKEIVAEIDGYQKIIDGARQVVENYQPRIQVDPDWPIVKFEEAPFKIIDGDRGTNYPTKEDFSLSGFCLFLNTKNVRFDGFRFDELEFISAEKDIALRKGKLERGDVLLTTRGTIGNTAYYDKSVVFDHVRINSGMLIFRPETDKLSGSFLFHFFQSENFRLQRESIVSGAAQPQLPIRSLNEVRIPIPDIHTQQSIVATIEEEKQLINSNKKLIGIFEDKIKATINRVWGED